MTSKLLRFAKHYWIDGMFLGLVVLFGFLYFVVYMTPGKAAWYRDSFDQLRSAVAKRIEL